jgi:type IV pilus assembly protein PilW
MLMTYKRSRGVTLIEMLVGLLVGLVVVAAAGSVYISTFRGQTGNTKLVRLNQDLRAMMDIMARDIRRAGFVTNDPITNFSSLQTNPFFSGTEDLAIYNSGNCIVYSYNKDNDSPPVVDNNERFGFRKTGTELQMRTSGTTNANCTDGSWETITEPQVEITGLTFAPSSSTLNSTSMSIDTDGDGCLDGDDADPITPSATCKTGNYGNGLCDIGEACNNCSNTGSSGDPACLTIRTITITLSGQVKNDPSVSQTITHQVRIRNDKFTPAVP